MKKMNLIKKIVATATIAALSVSMFAGTVIAGQFKTTEKGIWYENDDGSWPASVWKWIDEDGDGKFLCYAFDENGYVYSGTTTPDGFTTAADGSWIKDGVAVVRDKLENLDTTAIASAAAQTAQMLANGDSKASQEEINKINGIQTIQTSETKQLSLTRHTTTNVDSTEIVQTKYISKKTTVGATGATTSTEDDGPDMSQTSFDTNGPSVPEGAAVSSAAPLTDTSTINFPGPDGKYSDGSDEE